MITKPQPSETIYDWASIHPMIEFDWRILNLIPDDGIWLALLNNPDTMSYHCYFMANNLEKTIEHIQTF